MAKVIKEKTRAERQRDSIQQFRLSPPVHDMLKEYAEQNHMSVSEAVREAAKVFAGGTVTALRRRRTRRISVWVPPEEWLQFTRAADSAGLSQPDAIEAALEKIL